MTDMMNDMPRPEHPRPDAQRERWLNLNGRWEFRFDPDDCGEAGGWFAAAADFYDQQITVPFPWQSALSGLQRPDYSGVAWYRRSLEVPAEWAGQRVFLRFGAVDYRARVWLNGQLLGEHAGGYTPFEFDITGALAPAGNSLAVRVEDPRELNEIPHGKQRNSPPDPWDSCAFTGTSGIWQTVWLEPRPASYIESLHITPDLGRSCAELRLRVFGAASGPASVQVRISSPRGDQIVAAEQIALAAGELSVVTLTVDIPDPQLWDVECPQLYQVAAQLHSAAGNDTLHSYFGMRAIAVRGGQVLLNGRPLYLMSALDQGYWPDGIYTPPSDAAMRADVQYAKDLGLNALRKHIKVEDPRFLYWADQLGVLIWADAPSPTLFTARARELLAADIQGMIERDYNHPSIVIWTLYNESWGLEFRLGSDHAMQEWVTQLYAQVKGWDPTRLVVDNSGWMHVKTDIVDFHAYTDDPAIWRQICTTLAQRPEESAVLGYSLFADGVRHQGEPLMMSEYGAGWRSDRSWGFREQTLELRRHPQIVGYTYTELYDIEYEYAGFALYDRTPKEFGFDPAIYNSVDALILDYQGGGLLQPGEPLAVPALLSLYSGRSPATLRWSLSALGADNRLRELSAGQIPASAAPYTVTPLGTIACAAPAAGGPLQLRAWLADAAGHPLAEATLDLAVVAPALPAAELRADSAGDTLILRFAPGAPAEAHWTGASNAAEPPQGLFWGEGSGAACFDVDLPPELPTDIAMLALRCEIAARPTQITQSAQGVANPSDLLVLINDVEIGACRLPGLHVHAGGALSRLYGVGPGEHGQILELWAGGMTLAQIIDSARASGKLRVRFAVPPAAAQRGGMTLFGARSGRYGIDPTITFYGAV